MARTHAHACTAAPREYDSAPNELGRMLRHYREQAGKNIPQLATEVGIDRTYLFRLEAQPQDWLHRPLHGSPPKQPARDVIISIGVACGCPLDQVDELLLVAGYAPLFGAAKFHRMPQRRA